MTEAQLALLADTRLSARARLEDAVLAGALRGLLRQGRRDGRGRPGPIAQRPDPRPDG